MKLFVMQFLHSSVVSFLLYPNKEIIVYKV